MRAMQVVPKDLHILTDISLTELESLDVILNNMVFNFNPESEEHIKAREYLENSLVPFVTETLKELTGDGS